MSAVGDYKEGMGDSACAWWFELGLLNIRLLSVLVLCFFVITTAKAKYKHSASISEAPSIIRFKIRPLKLCCSQTLKLNI